MSINAFNDPASKGSFPPTLNSTKFHPKLNIPSTINGFYNPNLRKDDSLPGTLLPKGRTDATTASIPFKVRETTTKRTHSRFKSRQGYEDLLNSRSETTDNYHPERSSTFRSNYQRGIKLSSSNDSLRTLRYTTDGVESNILPPMRASFMLHKDYEPPVKTAEASTETVSGLLRANVSESRF